MSLSAEDVARIAHLARIEIDQAEVLRIQGELNNILGLIETMKAVPTDGVEPMSHAQEVTLRVREDRVTEGDQRALFQSLAPQIENGHYLVPKVIE